MRCEGCGFENDWAALQCVNCSGHLQTPEQAVEKKEMWDRMPAAFREETLRKIADDQETYRQYVEFLTKNRIRCSLFGGFLGFLAGLGQFGFVCGSLFLSFFLNALFGALAGFLLNHLKGGRYVGLGLFGGAYLTAYIVQVVSGNTSVLAGGGSLYVIIAVSIYALGGMCACGFGMVLGIHVEEKAFRRRRKKQ